MLFQIRHTDKPYQASTPNSLLMNCNSLNLQIAIDPTRFVGLESVADAVEHLHSGKSLGKVCKFLCCLKNVKKTK